MSVWDYGWDNEITSVHPSEVNKEYFLSRETEEKNSRFILHYMQPHQPYISDDYSHLIPERLKAGDLDKGPISTLKKYILRAMITNMSSKGTWRLKNKLFGQARDQPQKIFNLRGWEGIRDAYTKNLNIVLGYVKEVVEHTEGNILITADHGELLGEDGMYEHNSYYPRRKENTEVPWLVIENNSVKKRTKIQKSERTDVKEVVKTEADETESDEEKIKKRLRGLGYF